MYSKLSSFPISVFTTISSPYLSKLLLSDFSANKCGNVAAAVVIFQKLLKVESKSSHLTKEFIACNSISNPYKHPYYPN